MRVSLASRVLSVVLPAALVACGEPAAETGGFQSPTGVQAMERANEVAPAAGAAPSGHDGPLAMASKAATPTAAPTTAAQCQQDLAVSRYVNCGADGSLKYPVDRSTGTLLLNFSGVGYHGGDAALPSVPVVQHIAPSGKDDTALLQTAINAVSARSPDGEGFRGRIVLAPGLFRINRTLLLAKSGVVVEGSASIGKSATTLQLTGSATDVFHVRGSGNAKLVGPVYKVAKLPAPAGSSTLTLAQVDGLQVGDQVRITSTRNLHWITKMWGGIYPPKRDGKEQSAWGKSMALQLPRVVAGIAGNTITLDVPIPDTFPLAAEAEAAGVTVQKLDTSAYIRKFGFAHMRLAGHFVPGEISSPKLLNAFTIENAEDGWIDDIEATDFGLSTIDLGAWTRHITVQDVRSIRTDVQEGGAKPFDISLRGQLNLVQGCASMGNKTFYVATQTSDAAGPNVVQNYRAQGAGTFEPHQRWSTGLLYDNIYVPDGGIALIDRGSGGSGHGWSMGYGVVYNSLAGTHNQQKMGMNSTPGHTIDQPPSAANYGLGLVGPNHSASQKDAHFDSPGKPVAPASLYAHQLWVRRGKAGLNNLIGPWQLQEHKSSQCLSVDVAKPGAYVVLRDCHGKRQLALWDITSRGSFRLGGTSLCIDADSDRRKTPIKLAPCDDDVEQHWDVDHRGGELTYVRLVHGNGDESACMGLDGLTGVVADCRSAAKTWKLISTHLAR